MVSLESPLTFLTLRIDVASGDRRRTGVRETSPFLPPVAAAQLRTVFDCFFLVAADHFSYQGSSGRFPVHRSSCFCFTVSPHRRGPVPVQSAVDAAQLTAFFLLSCFFPIPLPFAGESTQPFCRASAFDIAQASNRFDTWRSVRPNPSSLSLSSFTFPPQRSWPAPVPRSLSSFFSASEWFLSPVP